MNNLTLCMYKKEDTHTHDKSWVGDDNEDILFIIILPINFALHNTILVY